MKKQYNNIMPKRTLFHIFLTQEYQCDFKNVPFTNTTLIHIKLTENKSQCENIP